ncbi:chondroitin sulfate proteoglycan 4-like [Dermacentor variabilis]|uniref:chondroitin sulfate proteoglycan 4-like n=1 Tax=Dermacentor variabilis TaxID=34621 RepID=UPI003F5CBB59
MGREPRSSSATERRPPPDPWITSLLWCRLLAIALFSFGPPAPASAREASFLGDGFVSLELEDARESTDLSLRFRTARPDGLLLLAAGPDDYCLLQLAGGRLRLRLELGAGEPALLESPAGVRLDDGAWHSLQLRRRGALALLLLDGVHEARAQLPPRFIQLDIKWGLFAGGLGDFQDLFLGHLQSFRGCMADVTFNEVELFETAAASSVGVVWGECSEEFSASRDQPFSLVEADAYLALPKMNARTGGSLAMEVRTQAPFALVAYCAGPPSKDDFVALEVIDGHPMASLNQGNGVVTLRSEASVNDGRWHRLSLQFGSSHVELSVDGSVESLRTGLGRNQFFDLSGPLFLGGLDVSAQSRAVLQHGLQSETSLRGCLRHTRVNDAPTGLPDALVTRGLKPDCVWEFPCLQDPCEPGARCVQEGTDGFKCLCATASAASNGAIGGGSADCVRTNFSGPYKVYASSLDQLLALSPLRVAEGGSDLVTTEHIRLLVDHRDLGVSDTGVLFHVMDAPKHGALEIEVWHRGTPDNVFTLADLSTHKVRYTHDGSENHRDSAVFELEFRSRTFDLPAALKERKRFVLHVLVSPVNDAPRVKVSPGKQLRLAKGTRKVLSPDLLHADDEDTQPSQLVYTVLSLGDGDKDGFMEHAERPGEPLRTFTQEDIDRRLVSFVHRGREAESHVALGVSDKGGGGGSPGSDSTQTVVLRVVTFELSLALVNNTGLMVARGGWATISSANLSAVTNAPDQNLEIRYEVTRPPRRGTLERLKSTGRWSPVGHFSQRHIVRSKVRYVDKLRDDPQPTPPLQPEPGKGDTAVNAPDDDSAASDSFQFFITCASARAGPYEFRLSFESVQAVHNEQLTLEGVLEGVVSAAHLTYASWPKPSAADAVVYTLEQPPQAGNLLLAALPHGAAAPALLATGSRFTQLQIDQGLLRYQLKRRALTRVSDVFRFRVSTDGGAQARDQEFRVCHMPKDAVLVSEELTVAEGGQTALGGLRPLLQGRRARFNVTRAPSHGELRLLDAASRERVEQRAVLNFTSEQMEAGRLVYRHDDSENSRDEFDFVAYEQGERLLYGTFRISVTMRNDNPPVRVVDRVFQVVADSERPLTSQDLRYEDADSPPSQIQYTRRDIPNGALFHADNMASQVYRFTQADLDSGKIIFRHSGAPSARAVLWVTDGQYYASGVLEIRASKPFVRVAVNTGLVVRRGDAAPLSSANLSAETNLRAGAGAITYKVTSHPRRGLLMVGGAEARQFGQTDLDAQAVEYESVDGGQDSAPAAAYQDSFGFVAFLGDTTSAPANFRLTVYPDSFWEPLEVLRNATLFVDHGDIAVLNSSTLLVRHQAMEPVNITFNVVQTPLSGRILLGEYAASSFTQADVNAGNVRYQHTGNGSEDSVVLEVSNGIASHDRLDLSIRVVPQVILLDTGNVSVQEGGQAILDASHISAGPLRELLPQLLVIEPPQHGRLSSTAFSPEQLDAGELKYQHDGSETLRDWFTVVARGAGRESLPGTVHVSIQPVNDEAPYIGNNTGLDLWEGAVAPISATHLAALDDDSEASQLRFHISTPSNGYVALKNDTKTPLLSFTQDQLNRGLVVFVHTGSPAGGFKFQVTDGLNQGSPHVFTVNARSLKIRLEHNKTLSVLPGSQQSITRDHLLARAGDHTRDVSFVVVRTPRLGRLLRENPSDGTLAQLSRFTQADIDNYLVLYEHRSPMSAPVEYDSFVFDLETPNAVPVKNILFAIRIALDDSLASVLGQLRVSEGGRVPLSSALDVGALEALWRGKPDVPPRLRVCLLSQPVRGWLEVDRKNASVPVCISAHSLDHVVYVHDDSETLDDSFGVGLFLSATEEDHGDMALHNSTLKVAVEPINDKPFILETTSPVIRVTRGYRTAVTRQTLRTTDDDGAPSQIVYKVVRQDETQAATLVLGDSDTSIKNFTQQDVDEGRVHIVHNGSPKSPLTFNFIVSDGVHPTKPFILTVNVEPVEVRIENATNLVLQQGDLRAVLTPAVFGAWTNADRDDLVYNVTSAPHLGHLVFPDGASVDDFTQGDLEQGLVIYEQHDLSGSTDSFSIAVRCGPSAVVLRKVEVNVEALVRQRPLQAMAGRSVLITVDHLDASKLAARSNGNPRYSVTRQPVHGLLLLSNGTSQTAVLHFTHEDVLNETVFYRAHRRDPSLDVSGIIKDHFDFELTAPGVQPGSSRFLVHVQLGNGSPGLAATPPQSPTAIATPSSPADNTSGTTSDDRPPGVVETGSRAPLLTNEHLVVIGVAAGVLLLLTVIAVAGVACGACRSRRGGSDKSGGSAQSSSRGGSGHPREAFPEELPTPPAPPPTSPSSSSSEPAPTVVAASGPDLDCLPPPPYAGGTGGGASSTEVSTAVPTCKVTPLGHAEAAKTPSEGGASESDDWNGDVRFSAPTTVLRKNQYWV